MRLLASRDTCYVFASRKTGGWRRGAEERQGDFLGEGGEAGMSRGGEQIGTKVDKESEGRGRNRQASRGEEQYEDRLRGGALPVLEVEPPLP